MSSLVIKHWAANTKPIDENNNFINITGRSGGIISWILSLVKIDPTTTILVGIDRIEFTSASLAGTQSRLIPLQSICSTYYGYHKPWKSAFSIFSLFVFFGILFGADIAESGSQGGAFTTFITASIVGLIISAIYYFLNRKLTLGFVEQSGVINGIIFKRSVIENVDINEMQAKHVCTIIQKLIEHKERRLQQK
ncbi:MAG: D-lyxose/D-mannose family sugar isomerase [Burkholderiales bacterium]|nr:D-lyxose/D-mannose family sugar isomerase [Burkholderiales bacterium]